MVSTLPSMTMIRHSTLVALFAIAACPGSNGADGPDLPEPLRDRTDTQTVRPLSRDYAPNGTTLWVVSPKQVPADAERSARVVAVTEGGEVLSGRELFRKVADASVSADELARRALDVLLAKEGQEPIGPDHESQFIEPEERTLIAEPELEDGVLTFWIMKGSMNPTPARYRVTVPGGETDLKFPSELQDAAP